MLLQMARFPSFLWLSNIPMCNVYACVLLFSHSVVSDSVQPHGLQHVRLPCPSQSPRVCISSSVVPFSSCLLSFPTLGYFPMSWLSTSCGQSIGAEASASVLPMNIHWKLGAVLTRAKPSSLHSQSLPSGSFQKPVILVHHKGDRMRTTITEN